MDESTARSRHSDSMRQAFLWALLPTLVLFLIAPSVGDAQVPVVTNITSSGLAQAISAPPSAAGMSTTLPEGPDREMAPTSFTASETSVSVQGILRNFLNNPVTGPCHLKYPWSRHRRKRLKHLWHDSNHRLWQCQFVSG